MSKTKLTVTLEYNIHKKLRAIAEQDTRTPSQMVKYLIKREIKLFEERHGAIEIEKEEEHDPPK